MTTGTTGKPSVVGLRQPAAAPAVPVYRPIIPDFTPIAHAIAGAKGQRPSPFPDTTSLGAEVMRLKKELASPTLGEAARAAVRQQIVMRQAEWVTKAKAEGRREPTGPLDPFRASPAEIENAFLWSAAGGAIPPGELARDGGRAFSDSIRDAVVLRTRGFEAMAALHTSDEQRALYAQELARRGVKASEGASLETLRAFYAESIRNEASQRRTIGLDGRVGTAEVIDTYERQEAIDAMNPGTTLGSMMATYSTLATGELDVDRMRAMGNAGNAAEGMLGGSGVHLNKVAAEREPPGALKPDLDNFNRTGLKPKYEVTPMNSHYEGEHRPGNEVWNRGMPTKPYEVKYATRPTDRAPYKLEAREVLINGQKEVRLFDAKGNLFDTRQAETHEGQPRAIFVMNAQGEIFASTYQEARYMHHSSLSGGEPVAAAGELVVENGRVVGITNKSGHYRPDARFTEQAITSLRARGLDLSGVKVMSVATGPDPFANDVRVLP